MSAESLKHFNDTHIPRVLKAQGLPPDAIKIHTPTPSPANSHTMNGHEVTEEVAAPDLSDVDDATHWNALEEVPIPSRIRGIALKSALALIMMFHLDNAHAASQKSIEARIPDHITRELPPELQIPDFWNKILQIMNIGNPAPPVVVPQRMWLERAKEPDIAPLPPPAGAPIKAPPLVAPRDLPRAA